MTMILIIIYKALYAYAAMTNIKLAEVLFVR